MEEIFKLIENLIDDIERDHEISKSEILTELYKIKQEAEDYQLNQDENLDY
jgi:hypothetical protein|tara:strand:- start:492 stop:644 length:153 start_codon:yes stop_codon:yes gene_type:complete